MEAIWVAAEMRAGAAYPRASKTLDELEGERTTWARSRLHGSAVLRRPAGGEAARMLR